MTSLKQKILARNVVIGLLGLALIVTGVTVTLAYNGGSPKVVVEGDFIEAESSQEDLLGGITLEDEVFVYNAFFESGIGLGKTDANNKLIDGYKEKIAVIDLLSTSSASLLNPEGETIYVYDTTVRVQDATSVATAYRIGTSSAAVIAADGTCGADGSCAATTAADASILNTGTAAVTTALDTFFKMDYQGTDTRDGSGIRYVVPVNSGEYLMVTASSSAYTSQAVQAQIKYYIIED